MIKGGKREKIKRLLQRIITLLVVIGLQFGPALAQITDQQRLAELQRRRDELVKEIQKAQSGAAGKRKEISRLNKEIEILNTDIRKTEAKIIQTTTQIRGAEVEISRLTDRIAQKEQELQTEEANQDFTIGELYMRTSQDPLLLVFGDSVSAAIDEAATIEALETRIEITIDEIRRLKAELETQRKLAEDKRRELDRLKQQQEAYKTGLNQQKNFKNNLLTNSESQKKEFEKQLEEARKAYQDVNSELFKITQAARAKAASGVKRVGNAVFQRPVTGVMTTRFGEPTYVQPFHTGWDLDCVRNEPVFSPTDATIIFVGGDPSYGYGYYIDGEAEGAPGISWRVAHLSGFAVSVGDKLKRGDLIGFCGNTGFAYAFHPLGDGTHVHYEVRESGVPVDPVIYND